MTKLYLSAWLNKHTYTVMQEEDKIYLDFANKVYALLESEFPKIPSLTRQEAAVAITSYLEDKQSDLDLFSSYVAMIKRGNGAWHPMEASFGDVVEVSVIRGYMEGYDEKKVNIIDLAYLLAMNSMEDAHHADRNFDEAKRLLPHLQEMKYEELPSNDAYFDDLCNLVELGGWKGLTTFLLWLTNHSYFLSPLTAGLVEENGYSYIAQMYHIKGKEARQAAKLHQLFDPRYYELSVHPATFAEEFARRAELVPEILTALADIEATRIAPFEIIADNGTTIELADVYGESYTVSKSAASKFKGARTLVCQLVKYGKNWQFLSTPTELRTKLNNAMRQSFIDGFEGNGLTLRYR